MAVGSLDAARFALDVKGLDGLKRAAAKDPQAQLKEAAKQFEAVFLGQMLKSMRDAGYKSGLMDSRQIEFYQSLFDQQLSENLAGKGTGIAEMLVRQLSRNNASQPPPEGDAAMAARIAAIPRGTPRSLQGVPAIAGMNDDGEGGRDDGMIAAIAAQIRAAESSAKPVPSAASEAVAGSGAPAATSGAGDQPDDGDGNVYTRFVDRFVGAARAAAQMSGVPARLILAQAALETGWGRHEMTADSGARSHNLFGIKTGAGWDGATASNMTHEYVDGQKVGVRETFRAYGSYLESFIDHAKLLGNSARYAAVRQADSPEQAAQALQDCGYATDPNYADKLIAIMQQIGRVVMR
ncbi:MAG TPA: flagellar assembly peptidoglycan hydrolase FlgJ [Rhodanobacteraceae bacterium]|nr:flagellar assembly peptidoglycan hydrolase FlgJ [Rhodanobacteraceae bacterium]